MDESISYTTGAATSDSGSGLGGFLGYTIVLAIILASMWRLFTKAGKPGWAALIPFYNIFVLLEIVGRPVWWLVLMLIPFVNVVAAIILANDTSKAFGKGLGTTLLLIFLPFIGYPLLAFGDAVYVGPVAGSPTPVTV